MKKEIKGYKLREKKFQTAVKEITGFHSFDFYNCKDGFGYEYYALTEGSSSYESIKKAGVLDLWFEPVYKEETTLEVGKWCKRSDEILVWNGGENTYGFNISGTWMDSMFFRETEGARIATDKEVEEALIKEAKKRGFEYSVDITPIEDLANGGIDPEIKKVGHRLDFKKGNLYAIGYGRWCIFKDGQWAEIKEYNKLPGINGYQGEDKGTYLKYGCAELPKAWFENTEFNRSLKSIKLCSGVKVGKSEIEQISEYLNAK